MMNSKLPLTVNIYINIYVLNFPLQSDASTGWTQSEELLLLEGLELHGDSWDGVAQHVGTRSTLECLQHFLSLPIEEDLWTDATAKRPRGSMSNGASDPAKKDSAVAAGFGLPLGESDSDWDDVIPFARAGNPVMAQVCGEGDAWLFFDFKLRFNPYK